MSTAQELARAIKKAPRVYICGNGGSAANAIHIANDLVAHGIKAHALTADIATLTAIANDYSYSEIFAQQLDVFGEFDDLLIALSGSGKSPNILEAIATAETIGMKVFKLFGNERGENMQVAENMQLVIAHEAVAYL